MDKSELADLINTLNKYDVEQIKTAIENCQPKETGEGVTTKKKRGRPKKVKTEQVNPPQTNNSFVDLEPRTEEEKRIAEASKKLSETKAPSQLDKRRSVTMLKVACKNCGRKVDLPSNFPDLQDFICCIK